MVGHPQGAVDRAVGRATRRTLDLDGPAASTCRRSTPAWSTPAATGRGCSRARPRAGSGRRCATPTTSAPPGSSGPDGGDPVPRGHRTRRVERVWQLAARHRATTWCGPAPSPARSSGPTDRGETFTLERALWDHPHRTEWGAGFGGQAFHTVLPHPTDPQLGDRRDLDRRRLPDHRRRRVLGARATRASGPSSCPRARSTPSSASACTRSTRHPSRPRPALPAEPRRRLPLRRRGRHVDVDRRRAAVATSASRSWSHPHDARHRLRLPARRRRRPLPARGQRPRLALDATPATPGSRSATGLPDGFFVGVMRDAMCVDDHDAGRASTSAPATARVCGIVDEGETWRELVRAPARRDGACAAARVG